jgi:hypothetical protein
MAGYQHWQTRQLRRKRTERYPFLRWTPIMQLYPPERNPDGVGFAWQGNGTLAVTGTAHSIAWQNLSIKRLRRGVHEVRRRAHAEHRRQCPKMEVSVAIFPDMHAVHSFCLCQVVHTRSNALDVIREVHYSDWRKTRAWGVETTACECRSRLLCAAATRICIDSFVTADVGGQALSDAQSGRTAADAVLALETAAL